MSLIRKDKRSASIDQRLTIAEKIARSHARRLLRLEAEVGILRPSPIRKERPR